MFDNLPTATAPSLIVIGNFDGVHRGHQALLSAARQLAGRKGLPLTAVTFEPHPRAFLNPAAAPPRLMSAPLKEFFLRHHGADHVVTLPFTVRLATLSGADFITYIGTHLQAAHLLIGPNFSFGRDKSGDVALLQARLGAAKVDIFHNIVDRVGPISSSRIRAALQAGDLPQATSLLGRPYTIENGALCLLPDGKYPILAQIDGIWQNFDVIVRQNTVISDHIGAFLAFKALKSRILP